MGDNLGLYPRETVLACNPWTSVCYHTVIERGGGWDNAFGSDDDDTSSEASALG